MGGAVPHTGATNFGRRVAAIRTEQGITAKEFAEKIHVHPTTLSRLEHGKIMKPAWETVRAIADGLGVDPSDL